MGKYSTYKGKTGSLQGEQTLYRRRDRHYIRGGDRQYMNRWGKQYARGGSDIAKGGLVVQTAYNKRSPIAYMCFSLTSLSIIWFCSTNFQMTHARAWGTDSI